MDEDTPARSNFVLLADGFGTIRGNVVSLTDADATEFAEIIRPAEAGDLAHFGRPPLLPL